jgi:hypothetical protein
MSKNDYRNAPELNADAEKILEQLNYSKADLKRFADSGAFGSEI